MIRAIKIMVLALLLPLSACAADLDQEQIVLTQEQVVQKIKSELITIILNANRYKSSRLGVRKTLATKDTVSRNIID